MVGHGGLNAGIGEGSSRSRRAQTLWETSHDRESLTCVQRLFHAGNKAEKKYSPPSSSYSASVGFIGVHRVTKICWNDEVLEHTGVSR